MYVYRQARLNPPVSFPPIDMQHIVLSKLFIFTEGKPSTRSEPSDLPNNQRIPGSNILSIV